MSRVENGAQRAKKSDVRSSEWESGKKTSGVGGRRAVSWLNLLLMAAKP